MDLVCRSILALLAFYVIYSDCITLPTSIKKNKNLFYLLIGGLYLYTYDNKVEGMGINITTSLPFKHPWTIPIFVVTGVSIALTVLCLVLDLLIGFRKGEMKLVWTLTVLDVVKEIVVGPVIFLWWLIRQVGKLLANIFFETVHGM